MLVNPTIENEVYQMSELRYMSHSSIYFLLPSKILCDYIATRSTMNMNFTFFLFSCRYHFASSYFGSHHPHHFFCLHCSWLSSLPVSTPRPINCICTLCRDNSSNEYGKYSMNILNLEQIFLLSRIIIKRTKMNLEI